MLVGLCLSSFSFFAVAASPTATIEMMHSYDRYVSGGSYPVLFKITIEEGWGIHGPHEGEEGLIPTRLSFDPSSELTIVSVVFPQPQKQAYDYTSEAIEVYTKEVWVKASLLIHDSPSALDTVLSGRFSYQACSTHLCRPPETVSIVAPIAIVPAGVSATRVNQALFAFEDETPDSNRLPPGPTATSGFWYTLMGLFIAGLALNLTPCIYPLIPITVSYFGGRSADQQQNKWFHAVLYTTGLSITNSILGVVAALTGGLVGATLQHPIVLIFISSVMIGLSLSFFGVWEFRVPHVFTRAASSNYQGYFGTFFMGLTLGIVAAPCVGPFIIGLLAWVSRIGDPLIGFFYFFVLSIGMALPLCLLALFSGALHRLPKSGDWMIWIRKIMGWILVAMAAYIVKPIIADTTVKEGLFCSILIAAGLHLGFLERSTARSARFLALKRTVGILFCLAGVFSLIYPGRPAIGVSWRSYSPETVVEAKNANRPVLLDFYADWCLPCKELDHGVFADSRVVELSNSFLPLRLDLTRRQPHQDQLLRKYNVRGVPAVLFIDSEGHEKRELRVESYVEADEFLHLMKRALREDAKE